MDKDNSELIEYLDQKFTRIDERFERIDERFGSIDKKFSNIDKKFDNVDKRLIVIESRLENLEENKADKSDINNLLNAIDAYAKKADTFFQEMVMLAHKVDRLERWIQQIAKATGVKLED